VFEFGRDHGFMTSGCGDHFSGLCPSGDWTDDAYLDAVAERMLAYTLIGDGDISVVVAPESVTLPVDGEQSFTATVTGAADASVTWSATCGSVSGGGNTVTYTAPGSEDTCLVRATSVADVDAWGEATVTVTEVPVVSVSVAPLSVTVPVNGTQSFTATVTGASDTSVTWGPSCGSISGSGNTVTYTAPATAGECDVTATSVADSSKSASASVTVDGGGSGFDPAPSYITIENVGLGAASGGTRRVGFDISWDESWRGPDRPLWVAASDNWDAAWVFVKYRVSGGPWQHATLAGSGHVVPSGAVVDVPSDGAGAFVYRSGSGYGMFAADGVGLQWDYVADGVSAGASVEVQPFGIEMVFVPQGSFSVGSVGTNYGEFRAGGTTNTPFVVGSQSSIALGDGSGELMWTNMQHTGSPLGSTNASFPTGFRASYVMKHQLTQGQYVDFLNTLTQAQADARKYTGSTNRYAITGSSVGTYATSLPFVALNYVSWADGAAFADWAGLRPLTELEFEKVARGPLNPVANEFAWGSMSISQATGLADAGTITETPSPAGANANNASDIGGPVRVGSFAAPGRSRRDAGAGYYGALELSGNLWERPVTVGNAEGRAFAGTHGDGLLDAGGNANEASWPGPYAVGAGFRGGGWIDYGYDDVLLRVSTRNIAALTNANRNGDDGWRGARSAP
jgi:hypothetical protein